MELELGLSLSNAHFTVQNLKELDLISYVNCDLKQVYDDNSSLSSQSSVNNDEFGGENYGICFLNGRKKREFDEVESSVSTLFLETLPLLIWDDKEINEQDKDCKRLCKSRDFNKNEVDCIMGWPPIKSCRKKLSDHQNEAHHHHHHRLRHHVGNFPASGNGGACGGSSPWMYVKVQMEGFLITRKIDLKLFQSYESLTCSLLTMFGKGQDNVDGYKLTYQDREGDWLLAGDVPWRTFIGSVQRLKLLRRN